MPLHRLLNPGPDALVCADGTFWEVGEQRDQDPKEHFTARALYTGRLADLGTVASFTKAAAAAKSDKDEGAS